MKLGKVMVVLLAFVMVGAVFLVFQGDVHVGPLATRNTAEVPGRRGDDPTYAEELKTMSALVQEVRYELSQTNREMLKKTAEMNDRIREETNRATRAARDENAQLKIGLGQLKTQLEQSRLLAANDSKSDALQQQISTLQDSQAALENALDAAQSGQAVDTTKAARPTAANASDDLGSEANRILNPTSQDEPVQVATLTQRLNDMTEPPEGKINDVTELPEGKAGEIQVDQSVVDQLRGVPGLRTVVQLLDKQSGSARTKSATPTEPGKLAGYVTIRPYVAGAENNAARSPFKTGRTDGENAVDDRLRISPFPFEVKTNTNGASAVIPVYTLPDAATLVNNSTMTPLVGRVPLGGRLRDPFRFKLITGAVNLATNGHRIPGIVNAVWTGYAAGVREQSCVRAYIDTVTFTFEDGRIHTVNKGKGSADPTASVTQNLGFLTDQWGKPCIRGQFFNNASQYLVGRTGAAFLDGLASAYAQSQFTFESTDDGIVGYLTGDPYEFAASEGIAGSAEEIADYVRERAADAFDVVYVPPGINVQVFVETEIPIDYNTQGRKLSYDYTGGSGHDRLD